jgi:hypothetical protein
MRALNFSALTAIVFGGCTGSESSKQIDDNSVFTADTFWEAADLQLTVTDVDGVHDVGDASASWAWMQATDGCTVAWHLSVKSIERDALAIHADLSMSVPEGFANSEPVFIAPEHSALAYFSATDGGTYTDLHWMKRYRGGQAVWSLQPDESVVLQFSGGELCRGELPDMICTPDVVAVSLSTDALPVSDKCFDGQMGWNDDADGNELCVSEYRHEYELCAPSYDAP